MFLMLIYQDVHREREHARAMCCVSRCRRVQSWAPPRPTLAHDCGQWCGAEPDTNHMTRNGLVWPLGPASALPWSHLVTLVNLHYTIPDVGLQDIRLEEGSSVLAPDKSLVIEIMADQHHAMLSLFITLSLGSVDDVWQHSYPSQSGWSIYDPSRSIDSNALFIFNGFQWISTDFNGIQWLFR